MYPENVPLASTASVATHVSQCLGIMVNGELAFAFRRGTPYAKVKRFADLIGGEVYLVDCRISYELLPTNRYYDHSPQISV